MSKLTAKQKDRLIESAQNAITFTVHGRGVFPWDMLRYDKCWPATESDSNKLDQYGLPTDVMSERTITMRGLVGPTFARWRSFNWEVVDLGDERR